MKAVRHFGIVVTDMEKALRFYRDLLGLKVAKDFSEEGDYIDSISRLSGVRVRMVKLTADDGSMVELLQYLSHPREAPDNRQLCDIGCSHIAFTVANIDKEYARLSKSGVRFNCPPCISPDGYAKVAFCRDPDGTSLELVEVLDQPSNAEETLGGEPVVGYLSVVYSQKRRPYTSYPGKLCQYIAENYLKPEYKTLLDVGCGRGEHLREFQKLGYRVRGVDLSKEAKELLKDMEIDILDVEKEPLPYGDSSFDVVFNKSLIEHLNNPENFMREAYRVLKAGGRLITMTPDWESLYKIFYEDYTHKTPFTENSLIDIHQIFGFKKVGVRKFRQIPILWKYPFLNIFSRMASYFPKSENKFIRFSKEIMLLSRAEK